MKNLTTLDYVKSVYELSDSIVENASHVRISDEGVEKFAENIASKEIFTGTPNEDTNVEQSRVLRELLASSVNFCYWYGGCNSNSRSRGSSAMYKILDEVIRDHAYVRQADFFSEETVLSVINDFYHGLMQNRFSMLRERRERLTRLADRADMTVNLCASIVSGTIGLNRLLPNLFELAPELAEDLFLKRAFLFPLVLNRASGYFSQDIHNIPVPADYQIPKMLKNLGVLQYTPELEAKVNGEVLIPKNSAEECEIRASTVLACRSIAARAGVTMQQVDDYLFSIRKTVDDKHHLTRTADY